MITRRAPIYIAIYLTLAGCSFWEEDVLHVPDTPEFAFTDGIDRINLTANKDGNKVDYTWTSTTPVTITQDTGDKLKAYFKIPPGSPTVDTDITLEVRHKNHSKSSTQTITIPAYSEVRAHGLGQSAVVEKSNDVDYEWYFDQGTSTYPASDCGPTSVTMAIKWFNRNFTGTPAMARNTYRSSGGWWSTVDVSSYLANYHTPNYTIALSSQSDLKREIDNGNLLILCLDMYYVSDEVMKEYHVNKFYKTAAAEWGHFIVIKGYKEVETNGTKTLYMEAYDPYSQGVSYAGNDLKGKNRYYTATDLMTATNKWWRYAIVVTTNSNASRMGLSRVSVPVQIGR